MTEIHGTPGVLQWAVCDANEEAFQRAVAALGYKRQPSQYEEVRVGERRQLSLSEFERFENAELGFVCGDKRMKPQKIEVAGFVNTMEEWWVEFQEWPEK